MFHGPHVAFDLKLIYFFVLIIVLIILCYRPGLPDHPGLVVDFREQVSAGFFQVRLGLEEIAEFRIFLP